MKKILTTALLGLACISGQALADCPAVNTLYVNTNHFWAAHASDGSHWVSTNRAQSTQATNFLGTTADYFTGPLPRNKSTLYDNLTCIYSADNGMPIGIEEIQPKNPLIQHLSGFTGEQHITCHTNSGDLHHCAFDIIT